MERELFGYLAATAAVAIGYIVAAWARRSAGGQWSWNVLAITQGVHARASLSKLQLFFFTLVVLWVVVDLFVKTGQLTGLSSDVLVLLGIGAAGTAGGKVTALAKRRLAFENWAWLIGKGWIKESIERETKTRKPEFGDLLRSGGEFDISKFQLLVFSLVVGAALIYFAASSGAVAQDFSAYEIPAEYLGLIGLSQVVYIGGKAVGPNTKGDFDAKLNEVRSLETTFVQAVARMWNESGTTADRTIDGAKAAAVDEYNAYRLRAEEAATMVGECIGTTVNEESIEPAIPNI